MVSFQYHPDILIRFPQVVGGVILAHDLNNGHAPSALWKKFLAEQQAVLASIGDMSLSELEPLAAWRAAFR